MTNYERIKAMSVEEMAKAICDGVSSDPCDYCPHASNGYECYGNYCEGKTNCDMVADWLNSETNDEHYTDKLAVAKLHLHRAQQYIDLLDEELREVRWENEQIH